MTDHLSLPARPSRSSLRPDRIRRWGRRDGIALPLTLWALVVAGALLTVATFVVFHEQRAAANGRRLHHALTRAESGLPSVLSDWTPGRLNQRLPRPFDSLTTTDPPSGVIHRFGDGLFLARAIGSDTGVRGIAHSAIAVRVGQLLGVRPTAVDIRAALTVADTVVLGGAVAVSGWDTPPVEWPDCPAGGDDVAGVEAHSLVLSDGATVDGAPPFSPRQIGDTSATVGNNLLFDTLGTQATVEVSGGALETPPQRFGSECETGSIFNWGDPQDPEALCGGYFPIIHVSGNLSLLSGDGQGILLVDGNLEFNGPYRFFGLVLVRGAISAPSSGSGVTLKGAVLASQIATPSGSAAGFEVSFSKCIIDRVLQSSGRLIPLRSRGWKQLFEVP